MKAAVQIFAGMSLLTTISIAGPAPANSSRRFARALPGIMCVEKYEYGKLACDDGNCEVSDPNHVFKLACETDCQEQHGAMFGFCLGDVCECGPLAPISPAFPRRMMCLDKLQAQLFEAICNDDCSCTHDRVGGSCNFVTHACECGPINPTTTLNCPFQNANEYLITLVKRYASVGKNIVQVFTSDSL